MEKKLKASILNHKKLSTVVTVEDKVVNSDNLLTEKCDNVVTKTCDNVMNKM